VFDEPDRAASARHPAHERAARTLRDKGNTVLVVEHKPETIAIADHVVDLGPARSAGGGSASRAPSRAARQRHLTGRTSTTARRSSRGARAHRRDRGARRETNNLRTSTSMSRSGS
jgi:excinuclease UvrABC ATPase subunit